MLKEAQERKEREEADRKLAADILREETAKAFEAERKSREEADKKLAEQMMDEEQRAQFLKMRREEEDASFAKLLELKMKEEEEKKEAERLRRVSIQQHRNFMELTICIVFYLLLDARRGRCSYRERAGTKDEG